MLGPGLKGYCEHVKAETDTQQVLPLYANERHTCQGRRRVIESKKAAISRLRFTEKMHCLFGNRKERLAFMNNSK